MKVKEREDVTFEDIIEELITKCLQEKIDANSIAEMVFAVYRACSGI